MFIGKCIIRTAVVGGLLAGVAVLAFPHRSAAAFHQIKGRVQVAVDQVIDDPVVLRQRLQALANKLPKKIAELRREISEVDTQIAQLQRDSQVAEGVIALTGTDLDKLQTVIVRAHEAQANGEIVQVRFDGYSMKVAGARQEYGRISEINSTYKDRLAIDQRDLQYLVQQKDRLGDLLDKLEHEYATIETRMWQIDRKIEAIERTERLVEALEDREATFDKYLSRFDIESLAQLEAKISQWEDEIELRFDRFERRTAQVEYEDAVKWELERLERDSAREFELEYLDDVEEGDSIVFFTPRIIE